MTASDVVVDSGTVAEQRWRKRLALVAGVASGIVGGDWDDVQRRVAGHSNVGRHVPGHEEAMRGLFGLVRGFRLTDARPQETPSGFVQQHIARGTAPGGEKFEVPVRIVAQVGEGRIERTEGYPDPAPMNAVVAPPKDDARGIDEELTSPGDGVDARRQKHG